MTVPLICASRTLHETKNKLNQDTGKPIQKQTQ